VNGTCERFVNFFRVIANYNAHELCRRSFAKTNTFFVPYLVLSFRQPFFQNRKRLCSYISVLRKSFKNVTTVKEPHTILIQKKRSNKVGARPSIKSIGKSTFRLSISFRCQDARLKPALWIRNDFSESRSGFTSRLASESLYIYLHYIFSVFCPFVKLYHFFMVLKICNTCSS
jgi:hypothetical protein